MLILAYEENSKKRYTYTVELIKRDDEFIVSLGSPFSWYLDDIKEPPPNNKMYIDAGGRNHNGLGNSVYVKYTELMKIVNYLIELE